MSHRGRAFLLSLIAFILCFSSVRIGRSSPGPVSFAPLAGTLDINGSMGISAPGSVITIDFLPPSGGTTGDFSIASTSTGSFAQLVSTGGSLKDLNDVSQPVGTSFLLSSFLTVAADPTIRFDLTFIEPGVHSSVQCGGVPALGQVCTPVTQQRTAFNQVNLPGLSSTISFAVRGTAVRTTTNESAPFAGVFTAQFGAPFQSVLASLSTDAVETSFSATFTITCNDTQQPTISCPPNIVVSTDGSRCDATVNFPLPLVSDDCPIWQPLCTPAPGTTFPRGTTSVTCEVTDSRFNRVTCAFTVTVIDSRPPLIACPADITLQTGAACAVVNYAAPTASDNCTGGSVVCSPPSGSCFQQGITTVTCTATDASNNTASCSFAVRLFNHVIADDSNGKILAFSSTSGDFQFVDCLKGTTLTGRGSVTINTCKTDLRVASAGSSVTASSNSCTRAGDATVTTGGFTHTLHDSNIADSIDRCR